LLVEKTRDFLIPKTLILVMSGAASGLVVFLRHVVALRLLVFPLFLVGMMLGLPSTVTPGLQSSTFGSHNFLYAGVLGAFKGAVSLVTAPLLGVISDRHGRKRTLFGICVALAIPPFIMGFTGSFWGFCILDIFFGVYSGALSVLLASIADVIPAPTADQHPRRGSVGTAGGNSGAGTGFHAHGFAVGMAAFGFGVGVGSGIGVAVGTRDAFRLSAFLGIFCALYAIMLFPEVFLPSAALAPVRAADTAPATPQYSAHTVTQPPAPGTAHVTAVAVHVNTSPPSAASRPVSIVSTPNGSTSIENDDDEVTSDDVRLLNETQDRPIGLRAVPAHMPLPHTPITAAPLHGLAKVAHELREDALKIVHATRSNQHLMVCFMVVLLDSLAEQTMVNLALLYLQEQLGFTDGDQLALIVVLGISGVLCLLVVIPFMTKTIGTISTLQWALVANCVSIAGYAFVQAKWEAITLPVLCVLGAGVFPCTSAIAAAAVSSREEGLAQGVTAGGRMLAEGLSPAILGVLFFAFKHTALPGAPFLFAAGFVVAALVLTKKLRVRADGSIPSPDLDHSDHDE
jgi:MFS family permease